MVYINTRFNAKQYVFLDFVLSHYVAVGVEELDKEKLSALRSLKYHDSIADATNDLGSEAEINQAFAGFKKNFVTTRRIRRGIMKASRTEYMDCTLLIRLRFLSSKGINRGQRKVKIRIDRAGSGGARTGGPGANGCRQKCHMYKREKRPNVKTIYNPTLHIQSIIKANCMPLFSRPTGRITE